MNYFRYKLIDPKGKIISGVQPFPYEDIISVTSHLERDGGLTLNVSKLGKAASLLFTLGSLGRRKRLKRPDQAELLSNLSLMLASGMPLTTALEEAAASVDAPLIADQINHVIAAVKEGVSFSESAVMHKELFPESIIYLIRIGEETGRLDKMLQNGSGHIKQLHTIISDTKQALLYPLFVFLSIGGGIVFWFYYVVPKILSLFKEMNLSLPAITVYLLKISNGVQAYFIPVFSVILIIVTAVSAGRKGSRQVKKAFDRFMLRLPIVGTVISASNLAYITEYFSLLIAAGIDVLQAIGILEQNIKNAVYRYKLRDAAKGLKNGMSIADAFKSVGIFPRFVTRMIHIGEKSGTLSDQSARIAEEYRLKLSALVSTIGKMLEPMILVTAGAVFAVIFLALLLPIYDLATQISR